MAEIIPFEQATAGVPAFLQGQEYDNDMAAHASQAFPTISIKGKVFAIVEDGVRKVLPNPKDPDSPATRINVIIVKTSPFKAKTYYANGYNADATGDAAKPTCFSNDGKAPDASSAEPQCKTCAACKWNVFGTSRGENGTLGKGKACSDFIRVALCTGDNLEKLYLLRVPPASIKALGSYGELLKQRKVPYQGVLTELSFDVEQATPHLVFRPVGFVGDKKTFDRVMEQSKSEKCHRMIFGMEGSQAPTEAPVAAPKPVKRPADPAEQIIQEMERKRPTQTPEVDPAQELIAKAMGTAPSGVISTAKAAPTQKPAEAPWEEAKVVETDAGLDAALNNLGFD